MNAYQYDSDWDYYDSLEAKPDQSDEYEQDEDDNDD